jgi:hypothetical protein
MNFKTFKNNFKSKPENASEHNRTVLESYLKLKAGAVVKKLRSSLDDDVEIEGDADPDGMKYTMIFKSAERGTLGRIELIYGGELVSPADIKCAAYADEQEVNEEHKTIMKEILSETQRWFRCDTNWKISYYRGEKLLKTSECIDEYSHSVKRTAMSNAPFGWDMIRLRRQNGVTFVKNGDKEWKREREGKVTTK